MSIKEKDFIEIEFVGKTKDGEVFDSNVKEELQKLHKDHDHEIDPKPFIFCIGEGMFLKGIEDFLLNKNLGEYKIELTPEKAFGKRDVRLIQRMPAHIFHSQKINPTPGFSFNFDGRVGKVITVSGGRVMVDFNNPLAGKDVVYSIKVKRKVEDLNEKIKAFIDFLFRQEFKFTVKDKKLTVYSDSNMKRLLELFKGKFKSALDLDLEVEEIKEEGKKE